jgi:signal transduction histidine kinase
VRRSLNEPPPERKRGQRSLHARIAISAAVLVVAALVGCAYAMEHWVERVVSASFDEKIDMQALMLERAIDPAGRLSPGEVVYLPDLEFRGQGWGWQVRSPVGAWGGGTAFRLLRQLPRDPDYARNLDTAEAVNAQGMLMRVRIARRDVPGGQAQVMVAAPDRVMAEVEAKGLRSILIMLAALSVGLGAAAMLQLHYGLMPLRQLQQAIARVRSGEALRLPEDQPRELQPLATELNALLVQNEDGLANARRHVANLAHGLKTPLATLALRLGRERASAESRALVSQLDRRIAHHLRRARSAAAQTGGRGRADLAVVASDLAFAMRHVHDGRGLVIDCAVPAPCLIAMDREDLDEVIGNLLDNACKWAHTRVRLAASSGPRSVTVLVCDDGPGISAEAIPEALLPGARLDETRTGYGFGLSIVVELAQLYGGSLGLERSPDLGGLQARLTLPRAGEAAPPG